MEAKEARLIPRRTIIHAVAGLSLASIVGYVLLMFIGQQPPEVLGNIALAGVSVLGGMAMPQGD